MGVERDENGENRYGDGDGGINMMESAKEKEKLN